MLLTSIDNRFLENTKFMYEGKGIGLVTVGAALNPTCCYILDLTQCTGSADYNEIEKRYLQFKTKKLNAVCLFRLSICFTAIARAFLLPTNTHNCFARVKPV